MSNISTDSQIDNNENKLWKINLDDGEERICGIKRGYKSKNLKTDKDFKELKEHKYVDKDLHDKLVKAGNETKVNEDYYVIIEKDELKEKLRDKNLYKSEHDLKHTSLSNSCEAYATGRKIVGINKLEDGPGVCCNGEEFLINNNKDIFNNTDLDVTYNEDNGTLESNKTCYNSDNKYARSDTLLTHSELKNLGRIYNISIKGTKQDICNRLYKKALRFKGDIDEKHEDDLEQEKINKNSTCYQLKKKECNNANNDCVIAFAAFKLTTFQPLGGSSKANPKLRSPAVVMQACPPINLLICSAKIFAPRCPPNKGTTEDPSSATEITGGSLNLLEIIVV